MEKYRLRTMQVMRTIVAYRFLFRNRFLTYDRGPLMEAKAAMRVMIEIE